MDELQWTNYYSQDRENTSRIFIKVKTSDGKHFFFHDYKEWLRVKEYCDLNQVIIEDLHLQFRSNKCPISIDNADSEGIYLIRSVLGTIGQDTRNYFTIGVLKKGSVYKQMWLIPELMKEKEYVDDINSCFKEALIVYEKKTKD